MAIDNDTLKLIQNSIDIEAKNSYVNIRGKYHKFADFIKKQLYAIYKESGRDVKWLGIIDYFEKQDYVSSFGMVGLSYGGFYTLYATALDTRIKSAISCSFFASRDACSWSDWVWQDSANRFDDAEVACLVYPRRLCLEMGTRDELFRSEYSEASFERIKTYCKDVGTDWCDLVLFDGKHEFCLDDAPIERLINDLKIIEGEE